MNLRRPLHLFEGYGIELEYMIVDKENLSVFPATDKVIYSITNEYVGDAEVGEMEWSNELALHVIELKTKGPVKSIDHLSDAFYQNVIQINEILEKMGGRLMPTAMHPWMDPMCECQLWPHDNSPIYDTYNRIFDCRGHGWANLQSMHINLPFADDEEFGRLHAAIRIILPLLPALAASSPIAEGKKSAYLDLRLEVYRNNQSKVPSIAGKVIPEPVFSKEEYDTKIFQPLYKDISPYDPDGILQDEWLNSRGAIARFDRNTIEIRLVDVQECPKADIAIAAFIIEILKAMISEKWISYDEQKKYSEDELANILLSVIKTAEKTHIGSGSFLKAFGLDADKKYTAGAILKHLYKNVMTDKTNEQWQEALEVILDEGTLSTRIIRAANGDYSPQNLRKIYASLCDCLAENKMFSAYA
jgi:glutamate---cysteine ligase / carboxylate-amine ligase